MKNFILILFLYFTIFPLFAFGNNSSDVGIPMKKKLAVSNNQWQLVKSANGYPVRDGKKSWMFTLKNGQCGEELPKHSDCKTDRQRSEATQKKYDKIPSKPMWYSASIFIPNNYQSVTPLSVSWLQIYETGHAPVLMLRETGNFLRFEVLPGTWNTHTTKFGHIKDFINQWMDIKIHIKYSKKPDGFMKFYVNEKLIGSYSGNTIVGLGNGKVRLDIGIYHSRVSRWNKYWSIDGPGKKEKDFPTQILYFDAVRKSFNEQKVGPFKNM